MARFHKFGLNHVDLNVHNIIIGADGEIYLIDFDKCYLTKRQAKFKLNLKRLERSIRKDLNLDVDLFDSGFK
jgi:3-deoxy-D-manno-octulosonic acid kinase